jgi:ketosteroid isomerase-like protein
MGDIFMQSGDCMEIPNEALVRAFLAALAQRGTAATYPELADHIALHIPGRSRFGGDYFGKVAVIEVVQAQQQLWDALTIASVRGDGDRLEARFAARTTARGTPFQCDGAFLFQLHEARILEWWVQPDDQSAFDAYWAYHAAVNT